jgi:hypothetical protein
LNFSRIATSDSAGSRLIEAEDGFRFIEIVSVSAILM